MTTILPGVPATACREQPPNANPPGGPQSGPNDMSTFLQRLNTGKTGGTSPWLVPCPGNDCLKSPKTYQETSHKESTPNFLFV